MGIPYSFLRVRFYQFLTDRIAIDPRILVSMDMPQPFTSMDRSQYRELQGQTGVVAALVGGFSLSNMWSISEKLGTESTIWQTAYVLTCVSVHACTCSALTSAFVYNQ